MLSRMGNRVQHYLVVYSAVVTAAFCLSAWHGFSVHAAQNASGAQQQGTRDWKHADFDQLTVHRINIVEPDGTPRWILSDRAEFPGAYMHGKEIPRPDRNDAAGWLTLNDEGTENGGFVFGGYRGKDGKPHSFGHLSFDEYDADQTFSVDSGQDGNQHWSVVSMNDNPPQKLTPELEEEVAKMHAMPDSPAKDKAFHDFFATHDIKLRPRVRIGRETDGSSLVNLQDDRGRDRIVMKVTAGGLPSISFLDDTGKAVKQWP